MPKHNHSSVIASLFLTLGLFFSPLAWTQTSSCEQVLFSNTESLISQISQKLEHITSQKISWVKSTLNHESEILYQLQDHDLENKSDSSIVWELLITQKPLSIIQKSNHRVRLNLTNNALSQLTSEEIDNLLRQWLVGHRWHPFSTHSPLKSLKPFQKQGLQAIDSLKRQGESSLLIIATGGAGKTPIMQKVLDSKPQNPQRKPLRLILSDSYPLINQIRLITTPLERTGLTLRYSHDGQGITNLNDILFDLKNQMQMQIHEFRIYSTVASFRQAWIRASLIEQEDFLKYLDLFIYDEAHHAGAKLISQFIEQLKNYNQQNSEKSFYLGFTATPFHGEKDLAKLFDNNLFWAYLDLPSKFDNLNFKSQPNRSIEDIIKQLELSALAGDVTPIKELRLLGPHLFKHQTEPLFIPEGLNKPSMRYVLNPQLYHDVFSQLSPQLQPGHNGFITVATTTEADRILAYTKLNFPKLRWATLHSDLSESEKSQVLAKLKNHEIDFIITVRMLDEGLNFPTLDHYIDLTQMPTRRQFLQRVARVSRLNINKLWADATLFLNYTAETLKEDLALLQTLHAWQIRQNQKVQFIPENFPLKSWTATEIIPIQQSSTHMTSLIIELKNFWDRQNTMSAVQAQWWDKFSQFIELNKRPPQQVKATLPDEQRLYKWWATYARPSIERKSNYDEAKQIIELADRLSPKAFQIWQAQKLKFYKLSKPKSSSKSWKELSQFIITYGRLPSQKNPADPIELRLESWWRTHARPDLENKAGSDAERQLAELQNNLEPEAFSIWQQNHLQFYKHARQKGHKAWWNELNNFIIKNKKVPSQVAIEQKEVKLATWWIGYGRPLLEQEALTDNQTPMQKLEIYLSPMAYQIWTANHLTIFKYARQRKAQESWIELSQFILDFKRLPSQNSNIQSELRLANWWNTTGRKLIIQETGHDSIKQNEKLRTLLTPDAFQIWTNQPLTLFQRKPRRW